VVGGDEDKRCFEKVENKRAGKGERKGRMAIKV